MRGVHVAGQPSRCVGRNASSIASWRPPERSYVRGAASTASQTLRSTRRGAHHALGLTLAVSRPSGTQRRASSGTTASGATPTTSGSTTRSSGATAGSTSRSRTRSAQAETLIGGHFQPVLFLLAPLYWVWADPRVLLVVQALLLASASLPLFAWAREQLGTAVAAVFQVAFLRLLGPARRQPVRLPRDGVRGAGRRGRALRAADTPDAAAARGGRGRLARAREPRAHVRGDRRLRRARAAALATGRRDRGRLGRVVPARDPGRSCPRSADAATSTGTTGRSAAARRRRCAR